GPLGAEVPAGGPARAQLPRRPRPAGPDPPTSALRPATAPADELLHHPGAVARGPSSPPRPGRAGPPPGLPPGSRAEVARHRPVPRRLAGRPSAGVVPARAR